jgi:hypothetical protein
METIKREREEEVQEDAQKKPKQEDIVLGELYLRQDDCNRYYGRKLGPTRDADLMRIQQKMFNRGREWYNRSGAEEFAELAQYEDPKDIGLKEVDKEFFVACCPHGAEFKDDDEFVAMVCRIVRLQLLDELTKDCVILFFRIMARKRLIKDAWDFYMLIE